MTNEEAQALVARAEERARFTTFAPTGVSWLVSAISVAGWLLSGAFTMEWVSGTFGLLSFATTIANRRDFRELKDAGSRELWKFIHERAWLGHDFYPATRHLKEQIGTIYRSDGQGEVLPLSQAVRLLDAHHRQQQRLIVIGKRLEQLRELRRTMHDKLAQLRVLGEDAPEATRSLAHIKDDEAALMHIYQRIAASCARLEAILTSVQHAHQVRQLKRELGELSHTLPGSSSELALSDEAFDVERQIAREIETFLQLERETDEHLRQA